MSTFRSIRQSLGVTQVQMAQALQMSQGHVSALENGATVQPDSARLLVEFARSRGVPLNFNHIYGGAELPKVQAEAAAISAG